MKNSPAKPKADAAAAATRTERVTVKVFMMDGNPPLSVDVPKVATVGEVIWSTIQQYEELNRQPPLVRQTRAYLLKMAEEDGTPEDMILKYTDKFFNFGAFFAFIPNPQYDLGNYLIFDQLFKICKD